jgi:hypothetical protein
MWFTVRFFITARFVPMRVFTFWSFWLSFDSVRVFPVQSSPVQSSPVQSSPVLVLQIQSAICKTRLSPRFPCPVQSSPVQSSPVQSSPVQSVFYNRPPIWQFWWRDINQEKVCHRDDVDKVQISTVYWTEPLCIKLCTVYRETIFNSASKLLCAWLFSINIFPEPTARSAVRGY